MAPDFTLKVRKFMSNPLLQRKQFDLEVQHFGSAPIPKQNIREQLSKVYKVNDINKIIVGGFSTSFGVGVSHGFGHIYESVAAVKKFEKRHMLIRHGLEEAQKNSVGRKFKKDLKTRRKKVRGVAKSKVSGGKK